LDSLGGEVAVEVLLGVGNFSAEIIDLEAALPSERRIVGLDIVEVSAVEGGLAVPEDDEIGQVCMLGRIFHLS
jgi:hypothetical protein